MDVCYAKANSYQLSAISYQQEFNRGYRQMIDAGVDKRAAQKVMKKNYKYFVEDLCQSFN